MLGHNEGGTCRRVQDRMGRVIPWGSIRALIVGNCVPDDPLFHIQSRRQMMRHLIGSQEFHNKQKEECTAKVNQQRKNE